MNLWKKNERWRSWRTHFLFFWLADDQRVDKDLLYSFFGYFKCRLVRMIVFLSRETDLLKFGSEEPSIFFKIFISFKFRTEFAELLAVFTLSARGFSSCL